MPYNVQNVVLGGGFLRLSPNGASHSQNHVDSISKPQMNLSPKINKTKWMFIFINLFLAGLLITVHIRLHQYAFDDSYIHFRVARNLFELGDPYFNASEPLKVSTSSGWIIFLSIIYGATKTMNTNANFSLFISLANAFISMGVLVVYSKIVESFLGKKLSIFQKIIFQIIVLALLLPSSIGLMETPLALLIVGLGIYFLLRLKPLGFLLLGISIYFRLELSILVILITIFIVFQNRYKFYQIFGYFVLGLTPILCFDLYYFHTIVPHSIIAKPLIYSLTPANTLADISANSIPAFFTLKIPWDLKFILFVTVIIMICWTAIRETEILKMNFYPALLCFSGLLIMGGYIFKHSLLFDWYIPLYMIPISTAYFSYSYLIKFPRNIIISLLLFFLFSLSAISVSTTIYSAFYKPSAFILFESGARVKMYLAVSKIINEDYPNATLLTSEIGGIGYCFKGKVFDAVGLASSDALPFHPMSIPEQRSSGYLGAIPPEYVKLVDPDIIVSYDIFAEALLKDDFSTQYNIITLPAYLPEDSIYTENETIWGSKYIRIYIRKSLPISDRICALYISLNELPNPTLSGQSHRPSGIDAFFSKMGASKKCFE